MSLVFDRLTPLGVIISFYTEYVPEKHALGGKHTPGRWDSS